MSNPSLQDFKEQVRHASDIVDVIGSYVQLKRAGANFKALSPFSKEKTPSFHVLPEKQIFKCFSSGHSGDVFKFLMLYEQLSFPEAVTKLAERAGMRPPESFTRDDDGRRSERDQLLALHSAVTAWWSELLWNDPGAEIARAYLAKRKIGQELAKEFNIGFAPASWDATMKWARGKKYSDDLVHLAGLTTQNESGRRYDRFRERLMFPIFNSEGKVIAFSGRVLDPEAKGGKYVNSPETPIFIKSRVLFGLQKTRRAIMDAGVAVILEGQIDLIRCYEHGLRNVVASQGTAFTKEQAAILTRSTKEVIICFDSDSAGRSASERSIDLLLEAGLSVKIASIPSGHDPDSLLQEHGRAAMDTIIAAAQDYVFYLLESACREHDATSPRGRGLIAEKMAPIIKRIPNLTEQELIMSRVAARLQTPVDIMRREVQKSRLPAPPRQGPATGTAHAVASVNLTGSGVGQRGPGAEITAADAGLRPGESILPYVCSPPVRAMLAMLLHTPALAPVVQRQLLEAWLDALPGGDLLLRLLQAHADGVWEDDHFFLSECTEQEGDFVAGLLVQAPELDPEVTAEQVALDILRTFESLFLRRRLEQLKQEIKSGQLSAAELLAKSKEMQDLRRAASGD